jgi:hypothetical protein
MPNTPNGKYGFRAWDKPVGVPPQAAMPPQQYLGPFASNQERLLSQSLAINTMSGQELQEYVRPPLPQVKLFPQRFGYETYEYGIKDIVEMTGRPTQRTDFSGQATTQESTSRNALGNT